MVKELKPKLGRKKVEELAKALEELPPFNFKARSNSRVFS